MIAVEEMIEQLSTLIREYEKFRPGLLSYWEIRIPGSPAFDEEKKREEELLSLRCRLQAAIHRFTTPGDSYRKNLNAAAARDSSGIASVESLLAIAKALCADLQDGWFGSVSEFIHAGMFSDFLEIARELHESDCKDAAAVQAGTALELHLRLLAAKHNIETVTEKNRSRSKSAGDLNVELKKADVYSLVEQQYVTARLAIRNFAVHGKFDEYSAEKVGELISGVREFVKRFPA